MRELVKVGAWCPSRVVALLATRCAVVCNATLDADVARNGAAACPPEWPLRDYRLARRRGRKAIAGRDQSPATVTVRQPMEACIVVAAYRSRSVRR